MGKTGRNITPPDMKNIELRKNLLKHCDNALKKVIELYDVKHIVCLGRLAEARAKNVIKYNQFFHINVPVSIKSNLHHEILKGSIVNSFTK